MRNMGGAAKARVLSEMYREKSGESDPRTSRTARERLERDGDDDAGARAGGTPDHAEHDAALEDRR
jgi:hypothetical protein